MNYVHAISSNQLFLVFLSVSLGYVLGNLNLFSIKLGETVGALIAGISLSFLGFVSDHELSTLCFSIFMFATAYSSSEQILRIFQLSALKHVLFTLILLVTMWLLILFNSKILCLSKAMNIGMTAGLLTNSAIIGVASDSLGSVANSISYNADVTEAFSVAYFFAMCLTVIWCSSILEIIFKQKIHQNVNQDEHLYSNDLYQTTHYPSKHPLLIISVGLVLGFAIGSIKITLFNSSIVIGSMGCLFSGVIIGKLTPISSKVAHLRSDAVKIIQAFGLSTFIAAIGLAAGSNIVKNFSHNGIRLVIISSVESLFILLIMTLIGKYIFKYQNVAEFGGVLSGARCSSTACAVVIDKAGNNSPIPSFVVTFILTNIISSFFGSMIVFLT